MLTSLDMRPWSFIGLKKSMSSWAVAVCINTNFEKTRPESEAQTDVSRCVGVRGMRPLGLKWTVLGLRLCQVERK